MPKGDGRGPMGQGHATGRFGEKSKPGHMDGSGAGPDGKCVCPNCDNLVPHKTGVPCNQMKCPKCGTTMTRKSP